MSVFQVFDNGKPADLREQGITSGCWSNSKFATFDEAQAYARRWLKCGGDQHCACDSIVFVLNEPHHYAVGGTIEIRKV